MRVRIWDNPRTTSNLNCLFWKHSWKWKNLSKIAGLNVSLNRRQSSSDKKHSFKSSRLVLFSPFCCCFAGSLQFSLSTVKQTKLFHSNFRDVFNFLTRKTLRDKLVSLNVCEAALQASGAHKRREFWRETHTPLWLLIGSIIFLSCENHRSLLWLAGIHLRMKIYDIGFGWVSLSMYMVKFVILRTTTIKLSFGTFLLEYHNNTTYSRLFPYINSKAVYELARQTN